MMKWLNKFQDGGSIRKIISGLTSLVKRAQNKDAEAIQQIKAILDDSQATQMLEMVRQTAPDLIEAMEGIANQIKMEKNGGEMYLHSLKCGEKSKKVKKKEEGEKINQSRPARLSKGKKLCPCRLAKVGGRIVEVDCEGNVVWNKQGGQMVVKAEYGLTLGNQTLNFGNRHLKTKDDILAMQGMKSGDIQHYYDPTSKKVMQMKYGESGWENPTDAVFTRTVEGSNQPETYTPTYGQGEGEINLWKDGYNLNTGLMEGETVTRNYGNGVVGTTNTLANTNSPLVRDEKRGFVLQTGDGQQNQSAKLTYNASQMARIARADRRANYWANREAGYTKQEAKTALRQEKHRDRNTIWGTQYNGKNLDKVYGGDYQAIQKGGNSYSDIYQINKRRRANSEAKVSNMSNDPTTISNSPAAATSVTPNASSTVTLSPMKGNTLFSKQGGWLKKFDNGGSIPKFNDGGEAFKRWWKKITQSEYEPKPITTTGVNDVDNKIIMTPGYPYKLVTNAYYVHPSVNRNIEDQRQYVSTPDGKLRTVEADVAANALTPEVSTFDTQLPQMNPEQLKASIQQQVVANDAKVREQQQNQARDARVRTFYSKMSDSDKRALQDMLKVAGYYTGEIDGKVGSGTLNALRKFQAENKLVVDGMAGRNTFDALRAKTRQTVQPNTDPTKVPGYAQAAQLIAAMNAPKPQPVIVVGGPTGGIGLNDVRQEKEIPLVGPSVSLNLTPGLDMIPQRKQGGWLNKKF